jgi:hypothetical protein
VCATSSLQPPGEVHGFLITAWHPLYWLLKLEIRSGYAGLCSEAEGHAGQGPGQQSANPQPNGDVPAEPNQDGEEDAPVADVDCRHPDSPEGPDTASNLEIDALTRETGKLHIEEVWASRRCLHVFLVRLRSTASAEIGTSHV